jgi:hypothetical protein
MPGIAIKITKIFSKITSISIRTCKGEIQEEEGGGEGGGDERRR